MLVKFWFCLKQESPRSFKLCTHHKKKKVNYCTVLRSKVEVHGRISGKGVHMYKGVGVHFADFISFLLNIP